jgi:hypothetical protein
MATIPKLTGTEKQITWAESIRAEKFAEIDELIEGFRGAIAATGKDEPTWDDLIDLDDFDCPDWLYKQETPVAILAILEQGRSILSSLPNAESWISRRKSSIHFLLAVPDGRTKLLPW